MNISAVNNVQFTGRIKTPATLKKGEYTVHMINNSLIESFKNENCHKRIKFDEIPLGMDKYRNWTHVLDFSKGILMHICKENDSFDRKDCDLEDGIYIGGFYINKNSKGEIDNVSFYDPMSGKSEVVVRDSKDLETLRKAFKNYNDHIKKFHKKDFFERKPYPINLLGT